MPVAGFQLQKKVVPNEFERESQARFFNNSNDVSTGWEHKNDNGNVNENDDAADDTGNGNENDEEEYFKDAMMENNDDGASEDIDMDSSFFDNYAAENLSINISEEDFAKVCTELQKQKYGGQGARLNLTVLQLYELLKLKHEQKGRKVEGEMMLIFSYDGAVFCKNKNGESSILSYNVQLWHPSMAASELGEKKVTTATPSNIITFMQVICNEKLETVFPVIIEYYKSKRTSRLAVICIVNLSYRGCWFDGYFRTYRMMSFITKLMTL